MPGVEAAGFSRAGILIGEELVVGTFVPQGRTRDEMRAEPVRPRVRSVSHGYLTAMGVRVIAGRELAPTTPPARPPAIVVNRAAARRLFGAANPVGQMVDWYPSSKAKDVVPAQVVGVVEDIRNTTPDREPFPEVFADYRQLLAVSESGAIPPARRTRLAIGFLSFAVRTNGDPAAAIPAFGRASCAPSIPMPASNRFCRCEQLVAGSVARQRFYAVMLSVFAAVAGFLAAIGIYGVLAYAVVQRTREIGIRMALGAQRAQVLRLILRRGAMLTAIGIALGLAGAAAGTRVLQDLLFGVTPLDPQTFIAVSLLFGLVATVASYLPARRATTVDPMVALRSE